MFNYLQNYIVERLRAGDSQLREMENSEQEARDRIDAMSNWELLDYIDDYIRENYTQKFEE